jgi:hypothetical protein
MVCRTYLQGLRPSKDIIDVRVRLFSTDFLEPTILHSLLAYCIPASRPIIRPGRTFCSAITALTYFSPRLHFLFNLKHYRDRSIANPVPSDEELNRGRDTITQAPCSIHSSQPSLLYSRRSRDTGPVSTTRGSIRTSRCRPFQYRPCGPPSQLPPCQDLHLQSNLPLRNKLPADEGNDPNLFLPL